MSTTTDTTTDTYDGRGVHEIADVVVTSFGYGHSPAPEADLTLDARRHLRNPHTDPAMRTLTGLDRVVREHVLATLGAQVTITAAIAFARDLLAQVEAQGLVTIAVGCVGGRHRSVAIAVEVAAGLNACGIDTLVAHRDVGRPVIQT